MNKKLLVVLLALVMLFGATACGTNDESGNGQKETFTVTFVQAGQDNVVKEVKEGETLTDIPALKGRTGYTVV